MRRASHSGAHRLSPSPPFVLAFAVLSRSWASGLSSRCWCSSYTCRSCRSRSRRPRCRVRARVRIAFCAVVDRGGGWVLSCQPFASVSQLWWDLCHSASTPSTRHDRGLPALFARLSALAFLFAAPVFPPTPAHGSRRQGVAHPARLWRVHLHIHRVRQGVGAQVPRLGALRALSPSAQRHSPPRGHICAAGCNAAARLPCAARPPSARPHAHPTRCCVSPTRPALHTRAQWFARNLAW